MLLAFARGEQPNPDFRPYSGRSGGGHTAHDTRPTDAHTLLLRTTSKGRFALSSPEITVGQKKKKSTVGRGLRNAGFRAMFFRPSLAA